MVEGGTPLHLMPQTLFLRAVVTLNPFEPRLDCVTCWEG